ncbi:ankyrin repeat domain protein [Nitzschia inconspicua]|uniref:Ankyrin repeat domain protein n=1 Tax=Nitzschia inconspicua TaxID=303405 RepID=A0A9K3PT85_9STRA|nr:ankyrin repeat domain protein [Nitzschia inconspicua]
MILFANHHSQEDEDDSTVLHKKLLLELRRLLYCMERHENMVQETKEQQSWQSILLRAQLLQDKWQMVANSHNNDWIRNRQEYQELSHRVDAACVRAREVATMEKERAERKKYSQFGEEKDDNNNDDNDDDDDDLIERLFFSTNTDANGDTQNVGDDGDHECNDDYDTDTDDEDNNNLEEKEDDDSTDAQRQNRNSRSNNNNITTSSSSSSSMKELQEAQREQMEHAISLMAKQMKEATQGIQSRIKQQNETTLNQLETMAEQNVHDVSQVAQSVKDHNVRTSRSSWATWTLIFTLVGVFCFTLMTIFTIPKSPHACLLCIGKKDSLPRRLLGKANRGISFASRKLKELVASFQGHGTDYDDDDIDRDGHQHRNSHQKWNNIYNEDEREREEKERLQKLLQNLKNLEKVGTASSTAEAVTIEERKDGVVHDDNPWGIEAEDDKVEAQDTDHDNPWGIQSEVDTLKQDAELDNSWGMEAEEDKRSAKRSEQHDNPWGMESEHDQFFSQSSGSKEHLHQPAKVKQEMPPVNQAPLEQVNVDDIIASLKQKMQETEASPEKLDDLPSYTHADPSASPFAHAGESGFDPTNAFEREGAASTRFSPRDFRVKAATNDYDALKRYISISVEHMNRQDRNGWSALHFATRSGHLRIVELLLDHGADPLLETKNGQSAMHLAEERFATDHPIIITLQKFMQGRDDENFVDGKHDVEEEEEKNQDPFDQGGEAKDTTPSKESFELFVEQNNPPESQSVTEASVKQEMEEQQKPRRKMFLASVDDGHDDVEKGRSRLDELLRQPPRKPLFATDEL